MGSPDAVYDADGQAQRRLALARAFTAKRVDWFNDEGEWAGDPDKEPIFWTKYMHVTAFMLSGDELAARRANVILAKGLGWPIDMLHELVARRDRLTDEAVAGIEAAVAEPIRDIHAMPVRDFKGDNDNHPLASTAAVTLWGTYTADAAMMDKAFSRLRNFKRMLTRRGLQSEYTAPGYTSMQLHPIALIAEHAGDAELRQLARDIETRLWIDVLGHFHFPSQTLAGPHTRAHNPDLFHGSFVHMHVALILGEDVAGDALEGFRAVDAEMHIRRAVNKSCTPYHCPTWLAEWALARQYPYQMLATADGCPSYTNADPDTVVFKHRPLGALGKDDDVYEHPAWHTRVATYMTGDYSLGTTTRLFSSAEATNIFVATAATRKPLESERHAARLYSRYVVNEALPFVTQLIEGDQVIFHEMDTRQPCFPEMGRAIALQHEKTAMVLYHPRLHVARGATSLKTMLFMPNEDFGEGPCRGDEIYLGTAKVENFRGESAEPATVYLRLGDTYVALIPMLLCPLELRREVAVRIRPEGKALGISFYNYQGPPLDLDRRRCSLVGNGFICEMGSAAEDGDFAAFRKRFETVTIDDRHHSDFNTRFAYRRQSRYARDGLELEMEYSPAGEGIRFQTVNGRIPPEPQLEAPGLPLEKVPFL